MFRFVEKAVKKNLKVDWTKPHRDDVKAGVRAAVKAVLRKRGVKPEHLEALTKQVIIQAEAMFREWPIAAWGIPDRVVFRKSLISDSDQTDIS